MEYIAIAHPRSGVSAFNWILKQGMEKDSAEVVKFMRIYHDGLHHVRSLEDIKPFEDKISGMFLFSNHFRINYNKEKLLEDIVNEYKDVKFIFHRRRNILKSALSWFIKIQKKTATEASVDKFINSNNNFLSYAKETLDRHGCDYIETYYEELFSDNPYNIDEMNRVFEHTNQPLKDEHIIKNPTETLLTKKDYLKHYSEAFLEKLEDKYNCKL